MQKVVFFFHSLTHFFIMAIYQRFSTGQLRNPENSLLTPKFVFSFKIKDQ